MWRPVINPMSAYPGRYTDGFDRDAEYEFKRVGEDRIARYRLADQHPMFNVLTLLWRPLKTPARE